ncbi:MAG: cyclase family protein [Desulfobacterales bacterium]|nr:cyclase family protein [Desulfobacterales bacterium]
MNLIDISLTLHPDLPVWPGDAPVMLERVRSIAEGNTSNDTRLRCSVHTGTHVDAPCHFLENGTSADQLPLDVLVGPAAVVAIEDTEVITPNDLMDRNLPGDTRRLLIRTPNSELWSDPSHRFHRDFVALNPAAAQWVVDQGIRLIGVDYLSVQRYSDTNAATHRILLKAGVVIVEGLDLRGVRPGSYELMCLPMKLAGSDGAPARAVLIEE